MVKRRGKSRAVLLWGERFDTRDTEFEHWCQDKENNGRRAAIDAVSRSLRSNGRKSDQDCASARGAIR